LLSAEAGPSEHRRYFLRRMRELEEGGHQVLYLCRSAPLAARAAGQPFRSYRSGVELLGYLYAAFGGVFPLVSRKVENLDHESGLPTRTDSRR